MPEKYVIITAGGKGMRMNSPLPKQFMPLAGKPVLMHSIEVFLHYPSPLNIILVIPRAHFNLWAQLCQEHNFHPNIQLAEGGPTRFHSVKNGLHLVPDHALVAIHDGVRPLVSQKTIKEAFYLAERFGNAIPVVAVNESVRIVEHAFNKPVNRDSLRMIQTPQCFRADLVKKAYETAYDESFTDDASVLERKGERIYLSEGNRENIKITTAEDLIIAEALLMKR
ncbi:MAG: 2-C-methyl-D-erythritol 4-phosphate cytidylyltransferase [Bacteroidota bacterium]